MAINEPRIYGGRGFAEENDQRNELYAPTAVNRFFESGGKPRCLAPNSPYEVPYSDGIGYGHTFMYEDPDSGIWEMYVNVNDAAPTRKRQYLMTTRDITLVGPMQAYADDAAMTADGWTLLPEPATDWEVVPFTPPAEFDNVAYAGVSRPANNNWYIGIGRIGFGVDPGTAYQDTAGYGTWKGANAYTTGAISASGWGKESQTGEQLYSPHVGYGLDMYAQLIKTQSNPSLPFTRHGWKVMDFASRHWFIYRLEWRIGPTAGHIPADDFIPMEIWFATDGSMALLYGDFTNPSPPWERGYLETFGAGVLGADYYSVLSTGEELYDAWNDQSASGLRYGYYIFTEDTPTLAPTPIWKKVDFIWPKINADTGTEITPYDEWPGGSPLNLRW